MPLQRQNITIPLGHGADTKTDAKMLESGKHTALENIVFTTWQRATKRNGYTALSRELIGGGLVPGGDRLDSYGNELLCYDENQLLSYSIGSGKWDSHGFTPALNVLGEQIQDGITAQTVPDLAISNGVAIYAWEDSAGGVYYSVFDESTEAKLEHTVLANASGVTPKCCGFANDLMVVYRVSGTLRCVIYNIGTQSSSAEITIASDIDSTTGHFDVHDNGDWSVIAYQTNGGACKVAWLKNTGAFAGVGDPYPSPVTIAENPSACITCEHDPDRGVTTVVYGTSTPAVRMFILDSAFNTYVAPFTLDSTATEIRNVTTVSIVGHPRDEIFYEYAAAQTYNAYVRKNTITHLTGSINFATTAVNTTTEQINLPLHGLLSNDVVQFTSTTTLPAGLSAATNYYVIVVDANNIQISATQGPGAAVNITSQGAGTHTIIPKIRIGTSSVFKRGVGIISKAFQFQSTAYVGLTYATTLNSTNFIVDDSGNIHARMLPTQAGGLTAKASCLPQAAQLNEITFEFVTTRATRLDTSTGTTSYVTGIWEHEAVFTLENTIGNLNRYTVQYGKSIFSIGGLLSMYDGDTPCEASFHYPPENLSVSQSGDIAFATTAVTVATDTLNLPSHNLKSNDTVWFSTTTTLPAGLSASTNYYVIIVDANNIKVSASSGPGAAVDITSQGTGTHTLTLKSGMTLLSSYQYCAVWEWADAKGNLHRSAPSVGLPVVLTGTNNRTVVTVPTLRLTGKNNVSVVIYRTQANLTTFYRITSITSPLLNNATVDTVTYTDTAADSAVASNEILYTTGNILSNDAAPACSVGTIGKQRMFLVNAENRNEIWYSKKYVPDRGISFSQYQTLIVPQVASDTSDISALAVMDEHVIVFRKNSIFGFGGDGPDATGANGIFQDPQLLTTDCGCINANTVVMMPTGLMFQSSKGIYLLNRQMQVSYIGAPVEAYNSQTFVQALLLPNKNQVRFLAMNGVSLVYDYYFNQWSTFSNHYGYGATIWQGQYVYMRQNGEVWVESDTAHLDNGSHIPIRIKTGWISLANINGFKRIYRAMILGEYKTPHYLKMKIGYDFQPYFIYEVNLDASGAVSGTTWGSDATWGSGDTWGGSVDNVEQFEALLPRQICSAIQFEITDEAKGTPGEGLNLSALTLTVGVKAGMNKISSTRRLQ